MKLETQLVWLRVILFGLVASFICLLTTLALVYTVGMVVEFPFTLTNVLGVWSGIFFLGVLLSLIRK